MQLSHIRPVVSATFDDPNLVSAAWLVPLMALAEAAGLRVLSDEHLSVPTDKGANAGSKLAALVAGMDAGADSIEDMGLLRVGAMGKVFDRPYAPSTLGSFLRAFTSDTCARSMPSWRCTGTPSRAPGWLHRGPRTERAAGHRVDRALWPHEDLRVLRSSYRFLSQVYASLQPAQGPADHLWHRLGAKTLDLVHRHMDDITVTRGDEVVVADSDTVRTLIDDGLLEDPKQVQGKTADDIIDSIAARLKRRQQDSEDHPVYKSLAERLERLRERTMAAAEQSIEWLREAFQLAKDLTAAEKAGAQGTLDLLPDPRIGALTQIFQEFAPDDAPMLVERVVKDIDAIVREVSYEGWEATQQGDQLVRRHVRGVLRRHQLHKHPACSSGHTSTSPSTTENHRSACWGHKAGHPETFRPRALTPAFGLCSLRLGALPREELPCLGHGEVGTVTHECIY